MRIEFTCVDGSRTLALQPAIALLHWLGRSYPHPRIENPEPLKIYVVSSPVPSYDHPMFLTLVYAEIERRWNKTPPFEVLAANRDEENGGTAFQSRCLEILKWLHAEGDITKLVLSETPDTAD